MDKELLKILEDVNKKLEKINEKNKKEICKEIENGFNEPAKISIEKNIDGKAEMHVEGKAIAILITLAGLEKGILEKLDAPNDLWELIKYMVGTREAGDNE